MKHDEFEAEVSGLKWVLPLWLSVLLLLCFYGLVTISGAKGLSWLLAMVNQLFQKVAA